MELRNIERAKELLPQLEDLRKAKQKLAEADTDVLLRGESGITLLLPKGIKMNILNVVNCEYERIRKEVERL